MSFVAFPTALTFIMQLLFFHLNHIETETFKSNQNAIFVK
jgi:hypothetical protein